MNRKGFTLIELIAVIVMIGLIMVIVVPNILDIVSESKETSYNTLVKNIVTSSEMYYEECEYGDLSSTTKYGSYACSIDTSTSTSTITIPLSSLANTGFLKVSDTKEEAGKEVKVVLNPRNNIDISDCKIKIAKVKKTNTDENGIENIKVTYKVTAESGSDCPTTEEYEGAVK